MQYYSLANTSLVKVPSSVVETPILLWAADGSNVSTTATTAGSGSNFLADGGSFAASSATQVKLHTLNTNWDSTKKYALEATIWGSAAGVTTSVALWDFTANAVVSGSTLSQTGNTVAIVIRSGQFTMIPGRQYGVTVWQSGGTAYISGASLIVFG